MPESTQLNQAEEHLRRARTDLSAAAQVLHAVADVLSAEAPTLPVTQEMLGIAFGAAGHIALPQHPAAIRRAAIDRALAVLPNDSSLAPDITGGEYALLVRHAAGSLT